MSLIYIKQHDENILDIEKKRSEEKHHKFPKYVSVHHKFVSSDPLNQIECKGKKIISASRKYSHKTLGYAETPLECPSKFLKKNGGIKWQRYNDHVCPPSRGLPPIPKRDGKKKTSGNEINFIKKNIKRAKTAVPQCITPKYVDTVVGEKHNLDGTGLVPKYVLTKKFGKTPKYLNRIKKILEEQMCYTSKDSAETDEGVRLLENSERNTILTGLRAKYSDLEKKYQRLPIFTDTYPKKQRKSQLEQELKRLEQDILLIENNPIIFICDD